MLQIKKSSSSPTLSRATISLEFDRRHCPWRQLKTPTSFSPNYGRWQTAAYACAWNLGLLLLGAVLGRQFGIDGAAPAAESNLIMNDSFLVTYAIYALCPFALIVISRSVKAGNVSSWLQRKWRALLLKRKRANETGRLAGKTSTAAASVAPSSRSGEYVSNSNPSSENPSTTSCKSATRFSFSSCRKLRKDNKSAEAVISSQELFASNEDIASLNVKDITMIFRYALHVNCTSFDTTTFFSSLSTPAQNVLVAMDYAASASRGSDVDLDEIPSPAASSADMDVLYLAAAVRVFADWRTERMVPPGYKRYAMGISLARRDLLQNIAKLEQAVHAWIEAKKKFLPADDAVRGEENSEHVLLVSPTLRQLLHHEIDNNLHPKLPRLAENSGGNGLLWLTRQLDYYCAMGANQVPGSDYPTTKAAVEAAYEGVYGKYHGWATQKIFRHSLQGAPEISEILKLLQEDKRHEGPTFDNKRPPNEQPVLTKRNQPEDDNATSSPPQPIDAVVENIEQGWGKFVASLSRFNCYGIPNQETSLPGPLLVTFDFDQKEPSRKPFNKVPGRSESDISSDTEEMTYSSSDSEEGSSKFSSTVEQDFADHCKELSKMLKGIRELILALNMNDPKKV